MSGCFGNHPVDRWMEQQLFQHLEDVDKVVCPECDFRADIEYFVSDEDEDIYICPMCRHLFL